MTKALMFAMASVLGLTAATAALADSPGNSPRTLNQIFMGMSNHAPPNDNAAASQGTRMEGTNWPRRWRGGWGDDNHDNGRWYRNNGTTVITDLPGKKR
jgi:hypothetical protein